MDASLRVQAAVFPGFQPPEGAEKTDTPRPVTDDHSLAVRATPPVVHSSACAWWVSVGLAFQHNV